MHEFFVVQNILKSVEEILKDYPGKRVDRMVLLIGKFSGIEVELLKEALSFFKKGTPLEKAEIVFEMEELKIRCRDCGKESIKEKLEMICPFCGGLNTEIISGDKMLLKRLELIDEESSEN